MIRLYIDAAVKGQPTIGPAGCGVLWVENGTQRPLKYPLPKQMDNHLAEFCALYLALQELLLQQKETEWVWIYTDSRIVYDTVMKHYHPHDPYRSLYRAIEPLMARFSSLHVEWIPDTENRGADQLAHQALALAKKQAKK